MIKILIPKFGYGNDPRSSENHIRTKKQVVHYSFLLDSGFGIMPKHETE